MLHPMLFKWEIEGWFAYSNRLNWTLSPYGMFSFIRKFYEFFWQWSRIQRENHFLNIFFEPINRYQCVQLKAKIASTAEYLEWKITRENLECIKNSGMSTYDLKLNEAYLKILYEMSSWSRFLDPFLRIFSRFPQNVVLGAHLQNPFF